MIDQAKLEALIGKAFGDLAACYGGVVITFGDRLGLYEALAGAGPLTSDEVAERAGRAERYAREWLDSHVAAGYVEYDATAAKYELPPEHAAVLADRDSATLLTPAFNVPASMWHDEEQAIRAFRTGEGVPWGAHAERPFCRVPRSAATPTARRSCRSGCRRWTASSSACRRAPRSRRLRARALDAADGRGVPAVALLRVRNARRLDRGGPGERRRPGVADRATFSTATATSYAEGGFDLISFFDALHDMGDPVGAARHARSALGHGGTVMLVEPYAVDAVEDNAGPIGRLYYSASTTRCTAHAISENGHGDVLGAQTGETRLAEVFAEAGYGDWRRASESPFNLVLEARA